MSSARQSLFTITIPRTVKNKVAAEAFVRFMLTSNELLKEFGLGNVEHRAGGDITQAPAELRSLSAGKYEP
jgi:hypothetical protein